MSKTMCWRVQVRWRGLNGSSWETGGDVQFPHGTPWDVAVKEVIRMRGSHAHDLIEVTAAVLSEDE